MKFESLSLSKFQNNALNSETLNSIHGGAQCSPTKSWETTYDCSTNDGGPCGGKCDASFDSVTVTDNCSSGLSNNNFEVVSNTSSAVTF
jgi:hypothetical protein